MFLLQNWLTWMINTEKTFDSRQLYIQLKHRAVDIIKLKVNILTIWHLFGDTGCITIYFSTVFCFVLIRVFLKIKKSGLNYSENETGWNTVLHLVGKTVLWTWMLNISVNGLKHLWYLFYSLFISQTLRSVMSSSSEKSSEPKQINIFLWVMFLYNSFIFIVYKTLSFL